MALGDFFTAVIGYVHCSVWISGLQEENGMSETIVVEVRNVSKKFKNVTVLDEVVYLSDRERYVD